MAVIGIDLGATKLAGALFANDGAIRARADARLDRRAGDDVGRLILEQLRPLKEAAQSGGDALEAVGVSVPGIAHQEDGTVWAPNIPGWERYALRDRLAAALGPGCVVVVEDDRACSILGEVARGAARDRRHAVFLAVGTGIGAGILVDGAILRGAHGTAGAIGWMGLDRPYQAAYDQCGGFESHASGTGIARVARQALARESSYQGDLNDIEPEQITAEAVFRAYDSGDPLAARVLANAIECWGLAAANVISLLDPEILVFGGGLFGPAAKLLDRIVAEARHWAQPVSFGKVEIVASALGPEACLYGIGERALRAAREA